MDPKGDHLLFLGPNWARGVEFPFKFSPAQGTDRKKNEKKKKKKKEKKTPISQYVGTFGSAVVS